MNNTLKEIDKLIEEAKERKTNHELVIGDNLSSRFNFGFASGCVYEINHFISQLTQLKTVIQGNQDEAMVIKTKYGSVHFETVQSLAESFAGLLKSVKKSLEQRDEKSNPQGSYSEEEGWISVEDKLPELGQVVIGYFPDGDESGENVAEARFNGKSLISNFPNSTAYCFKATHWMLRPQPPITKTN